MDLKNPSLPSTTTAFDIPIRIATAESLDGYGHLLESPDQIDVEIVTWPAQGWRPVDEGTGNEAGTTEGTFTSYWEGDVLYGVNEAVGGDYVLAYGTDPSQADTSHGRNPTQLLMWHANYHPDGGQLFFPNDAQPYIVPLALPGDDVSPKDFVAFLFPGDKGCYIHPNIWHDGVFPISGRQVFFGRQGKVHARVSVDFAEEFQCLLRVDLSNLPEL